jgi:hypothetical protein
MFLGSGLYNSSLHRAFSWCVQCMSLYSNSPFIKAQSYCIRGPTYSHLHFTNYTCNDLTFK